MISYRAAVLFLAVITLGACSSFDRLAEVGRAPALSAIKNPVTQPGYRPVSLPMPDKVPATYNSNSLWRTGSRTFFNDQRASKVETGTGAKSYDGKKQVISIINLQSRRTIHAVVSAPGRVTIQPRARVAPKRSPATKPNAAQRLSLLTGN